MTETNDPTTPPITIIQRRKSTGTPRATSSSMSSLVDFELVSIKSSSYTSLRDILPSPVSVVQSPKTPSFAHSGYEILIRNRLVKQAAWAYLQPMSTFPEDDGSTVFQRLWTRVSGAIISLVTVAFDCILQQVLVRSDT